VKVLRTVTLIELMLSLEDTANRADAFLEQCDLANPLVELA
jgi:hypothetical protein